MRGAMGRKNASNTWLRQVHPSTGSPNAHGLCQAKVAKRGRRGGDLGCPFIQSNLSLQQRPEALQVGPGAENGDKLGLSYNWSMIAT